MIKFPPPIPSQNLKAGFVKREPRIYEEDLQRVADLEKDMMMIKQEESWHEQLLEQQSQLLAASPLLEQQRGERRALIGKLLKEFTVKINKEEQTDQDHKEATMTQPKKCMRAQDLLQVIHSLSFIMFWKIRFYNLIMVSPPRFKRALKIDPSPATEAQAVGLPSPPILCPFQPVLSFSSRQLSLPYLSVVQPSLPLSQRSLRVSR